MKNRKEGSKKRTREIERERERDKERESEKGASSKKAKEKQRETQKKCTKMPLSFFLGGGGKQVFFLAKAKTRKQKKEGLGPSEVAFWATSPDP